MNTNVWIMAHSQPKFILSGTLGGSFIATFLSSKIVKYLVVMGDAFVSSRLSCHGKFPQCTDIQIFQNKHVERDYGFDLIPLRLKHVHFDISYKL